MKPICIPRPAPAPLHNDEAVSTLIGVIFMVTLMVLLTVILSAFLVGVNAFPQKNPYVVADAEYRTGGGYPVVALVHRAGDAGHLSGSGTGYSFSVLVSSGGSTSTAVPDPAGLPWTRGTTLFIAWSGTGYTVTGDPARIQGTAQAFPDSEITVSVMSGNWLVFEEKLTVTG